mgnify:CR=1 FL=1
MVNLSQEAFCKFIKHMKVGRYMAANIKERVKKEKVILSEADRKKKIKNSFIAYAMLLPAFVFLFMFTLYPIGSSIYSSLFKDNLSVITPQFVGFKNYVGLAKDAVFVQSFKNNLLIALVTVPISIILSVAMAIFTDKIHFGKAFARTAFFYPTILPMVAVANIWLFIYTPGYGILGQLGFDMRVLSDPKKAIWGIIVMLIWKQAGYLMIFYISGLQGISGELYEAAKLDGATPFQVFRSITWPLLRPTTIYVSIISLTNAYKMVDHLYIMTKGGPNNTTNMLLYYIFQTGFDFWDAGRASAMTVVLVAMLLIITGVQFFTQDRNTYYS